MGDASGLVVLVLTNQNFVLFLVDLHFLECGGSHTEEYSKIGRTIDLYASSSCGFRAFAKISLKE